MKYNFDEIVDRIHTNDMKWHPEAVESYLHCDIPKDMIPMWLADTDFACAPMVTEAVKRRADQRIFGYCAAGKEFYEAVCYWQKKRHGMDMKPEWITMLPTVVAGINIAIRTFTEAGEGVIIQQPVYDPFASIIKATERTVVNNGLVYNGELERFEMNYEELEELAAKPENRMMILCSPHNPVGRVWKREELEKAADICLKHKVIMVSDEIHADIVFNGHRHFPVISLDKRYEASVITLTAPGKSFNIAGLKVSTAIIPNQELRQRFLNTQIAMSLNVTNTFGLEAVTAAYTPEGEGWLEEEIAYMYQNIVYTENYIAENMPGVNLVHPEGTFLCWLDLRRLGFSDDELFEKIILTAGVICVPGPWFGMGGEGHMRLNIGCPWSVLQMALERMQKVLFG